MLPRRFVLIDSGAITQRCFSRAINPDPYCVRHQLLLTCVCVDTARSYSRMSESVVVSPMTESDFCGGEVSDLYRSFSTCFKLPELCL